MSVLSVCLLRNLSISGVELIGIKLFLRSLFSFRMFVGSIVIFLVLFLILVIVFSAFFLKIVSLVVY